MPHVRLEVPAEWLDDDFVGKTGFDARQLLDHLAEVVCGLTMENPAIAERGQQPHGGDSGRVDGEDGAAPDPAPRPVEPDTVPLINRKNLKHALIPVHHSGVGGDRSKGFLHVTFSAGNDTPGRTAAVRRRTAEIIGNAVDDFVADRIPELASVTVHVQDIDRERGYTTTAERKKKRGSLSGRTR
jgi:hypothetical protein